MPQQSRRKQLKKTKEPQIDEEDAFAISDQMNSLSNACTFAALHLRCRCTTLCQLALAQPGEELRPEMGEKRVPCGGAHWKPWSREGRQSRQTAAVRRLRR